MPAAIDLVVRPDGAVDDGQRAEELRLPGIGVVEAVHAARVGRQQALVLENQRDLVRSVGQQRIGRVADPVEAREPGIDVEPGVPQGVVVVPDRRRSLVVGVGVGVALTGQEGVLGVAVELRSGVAAVEVKRDPRRHRVVGHVGTMERRVHAQEVWTERVGRGERHRGSRLRLDGGAQVAGAAVAPGGGQTKLAVEPMGAWGHGEAVRGQGRRAPDRRNGQRIDEPGQRPRVDERGPFLAERLPRPGPGKRQGSGGHEPGPKELSAGDG